MYKSLPPSKVGCTKVSQSHQTRLNLLDIVPMNCYKLFEQNDIQFLEEYTQVARLNCAAVFFAT